MKSGTTSLHRYLGLHPQISMAVEKELNFFIAEANWTRGVDWYARHFSSNAPVRGESSPSYTHYPFFSGVPERMASVVPDTRLVYLVRDPIERIVSHYVHDVAEGHERRTLADALSDLDGNPYVAASRYAAQLQRYLACFPRSQILVIANEELRAERRATVRRVFEFLEVDPSFESCGFDRIEHRSSEKRRRSEVGQRLARSSLFRLVRRLPRGMRGRILRLIERPFSRSIERPLLDPTLRARLEGLLRDDARAIQELAGRRFPDWSLAAR
jgi:hypothetical protein